jgi:uncharacterized protein (TIGR02678 family)
MSPAERGPVPPDQHRDERRHALRALLLQPLITSGGVGAELLPLVRRHAQHLREWLRRNVDWTLSVEPDVVRLRKVPGDLSDRTRSAVDETSELPFSRRRYALLCLALAALERSERQTTLGKLAEEVTRLHLADPALAERGLGWDFSTQDARRDLVHAVRFLLGLGVLKHVHGDEQQFLHQQGDVLYAVQRTALVLMLSARRPPSMIEASSLDDRLRALTEDPAPSSDEARNRRIRVALTRRLLDDPVVVQADLDPEERAYLVSQRAHLARQIEEATGLVAEVRAEGMAMVDEGGQLTDVGLPEEGTEGHLALLVAELLAKRARQQPGVVVPRAELVDQVASLVARHGEHWRKDARAPGAEERLTDDTISRLHALGLVRLAPEGVVPRPAIGRYALASPRRQGPAQGSLDGAPGAAARNGSPPP